MNAILMASLGVVFLLIGGGIGYWLGRTGVGGSKARVEKAEAELEDYKRSVTEHFGQTAAHFQTIGKQYRELYEHMASGAQALCEPGEAGNKLLFAPVADVVSASQDEPPTAKAEPPADYAEPIDTAAEDAEAEEAEVDEPPAEVAADDASAESGEADDTVDETAAETQPETKEEAEERTIH